MLWVLSSLLPAFRLPLMLCRRARAEINNTSSNAVRAGQMAITLSYHSQSVLDRECTIGPIDLGTKLAKSLRPSPEFALMPFVDGTHRNISPFAFYCDTASTRRHCVLFYERQAATWYLPMTDQAATRRRKMRCSPSRRLRVTRSFLVSEENIAISLRRRADATPVQDTTW